MSIYMIQNTGPCFFLIHSWNVCITGFKMSHLLFLGHKQLSPLSAEQTATIWLRDARVTLTIPKAILFPQRSYTKHLILRVCFSPFFLISTLHFLKATSWWFSSQRNTPQAIASLTSSGLSDTIVFLIFLKW